MVVGTIIGIIAFIFVVILIGFIPVWIIWKWRERRIRKRYFREQEERDLIEIQEAMKGGIEDEERKIKEEIIKPRPEPVIEAGTPDPEVKRKPKRRRRVQVKPNISTGKTKQKFRFSNPAIY